MGRLLARATSGLTQAQIRHVRPVPAYGPVGAVYRQVARDFGMLAPPVSLHAPSPLVLAAAWVLLRETLVARSSVPRALKESVAADVSRANACPYCVDIHGPRAVVADVTPTDPELRAVALTFHYLNRMVNVFLPASPFPAFGSLAGQLLGRLARRPREPGSSLAFLRPAPLPADLSWASARPPLADAVGRAASAFATAGARSVPPAVRRLVSERLSTWDGSAIAVAGSPLTAVDLPGEDAELGRFALLVALASYKVLEVPDVDDRRLIEVAAWASFAAARSVTSEDLREGQSHVPAGERGR